MQAAPQQTPDSSLFPPQLAPSRLAADPVPDEPADTPSPRPPPQATTAPSRRPTPDSSPASPAPATGETQGTQRHETQECRAGRPSEKTPDCIPPESRLPAARGAPPTVRPAVRKPSAWEGPREWASLLGRGRVLSWALGSCHSASAPRIVRFLGWSACPCRSCGGESLPRALTGRQRGG
jgi:hypothetical protein